MMKRIIMLAAGALMVAAAVLVAGIWTTCRIYVPEDKCAVLIRKMGKTLKDGQLVATEPGFKGIQEEVLGPGRYFKDPIRWDWKLVDLTEEPANLSA